MERVVVYRIWKGKFSFSKRPEDGDKEVSGSTTRLTETLVKTEICPREFLGFRATQTKTVPRVRTFRPVRENTDCTRSRLTQGTFGQIGRRARETLREVFSTHRDGDGFYSCSCEHDGIG